MYALASLGSPPLLRGRRGTMCTAKGSDVRPGVPWVSASFAWQAWHNVHCQGGCTPWRPLGLRLFCVTHSLTLTHSLIHSLTHSLAHTLTHPLTHSLHSTPLHFTSLNSLHSLHSLHSLSDPSLTHTTLTSLTHTLTHSLYMNIHTYTQTHPPSPLHHSYTSSSFLAFL